MAREPLSDDEVRARLRELPGWSLREGMISRTYRLDSHFAATALVVHVAQIQEELNHHSDLTLGYHTVSVAVNTHDAGPAVTGMDFALARRVEDAAAGHGAR